MFSNTLSADLSAVHIYIYILELTRHYTVTEYSAFAE